MERVRVDDVEHSPSTANVRRRIADAIEAAGVALNYYELEPNESFSTTLHTHLDQEEVFYILSGTATFATDDGEVSVNEGEVIRFAPGEYQHGYNDTDSLVVGLAIGSPKNSSEGRIECPHCGEREPPQITWSDNRSMRIFQCRECGSEVGRQT